MVIALGSPTELLFEFSVLLKLGHQHLERDITHLKGMIPGMDTFRRKCMHKHTNKTISRKLPERPIILASKVSQHDQVPWPGKGGMRG